jgi:opacity protein-like surface antigen
MNIFRSDQNLTGMYRKRLMILPMILVFTGLVQGQFTHLGVAAGYGTEIREPGFGAFGMFSVNDQIKVVPNAMYYLPHKVATENGTQKFSWWTISVDGDYIVINQGLTRFYGIMGLTFISLRGEQDEEISGQEFKDKVTLQKLGLNIGAGIRFPLSEHIAPFAELKYTLADAADFEFKTMPVSQFNLKAGILFRISETKPRNQPEE